MSVQRTTDADGPSGGETAMQAVPRALALRGRALVAAIDRLIAHPQSAALDERQRAQTRDMLRKLVTAVEIDLRHALGDSAENEDAWTLIAARGLAVPGLARHVLAGVCERALAQDDGGGAAPPDSLAAALDAQQAGLWMRYAIAERRRRDGWHAPLLPLSDLPLEMQAALVDHVAGALMVVDRAPEESIARYAGAAAQVVSQHREETAIGVAADRLVDALLARQGATAVVDTLLTGAMWPALAALVAMRAGLERVDAAIYLATATRSEVADWLTRTGIDAAAVAAVVRALALAGAARDDGDRPAPPGEFVPHAPGEDAVTGIRAAARFYADDGR